MAGALSRFYSKLSKEIEKAPIKQATGEEWTNYFRNRGVKQEELFNWEKALQNMPADHKMSPREAMEQFRVLGDVPVLETRLVPENKLDQEQIDYVNNLLNNSEGINTRLKIRGTFDPKYGSEYSLAGAPEDAYEELVLHSPWAERLSSDPSHYTDVPGGDKNIAWLRYHMRQLEGDQPQNLFHLDELQSNRHQKGESVAYISEKDKFIEKQQSFIKSMIDKYGVDPEEVSIGQLRSLGADELELKKVKKYITEPSLAGSLENYLPADAPFKGDNWKNLGLRRALLEAAEQDADLFSWTPGKVQQQRWKDQAGEGTERFYDKYIPNQLRKDLKDHGITDEMFTQIEDPSKTFDTREVPSHLAALISSNDNIPDLNHVAELLDAFENNPSLVRRYFYNIGMDPDRAMDAMDDLTNFSIARRNFIDDPDIDMEKVLDFGAEFVPNYLKQGLNSNTVKIPAVRLTPEVRKSILEKGFPKYFLPLGAAGSGLIDEFSEGVEPEQHYAAGGKVVKKALKNPNSPLKELFEDIFKEISPKIKFAAGGAVRAGAESALHGLTLGLDETIPSLVAGHYAKLMRPDLFEDFTGDELVGIAKANLEAERHNREEEHPIADITGLLMSGLMPMGLAKTVAGQMGTGALMAALQSLNEDQTGESLISDTAFGAAAPAVFNYGGKTLYAIPKSLLKERSPDLSDIDMSELSMLKI
jgi:hypothetical protein